MSYISPHCSINGYDFTSIVYADGISSSGGDCGVEEIQIPDRDWVDIRKKGRKIKKYKIKARSQDRDQIETFLEVCNTAPEDSKFYPFDAQRFGLIASAQAALDPIRHWGPGYNFYDAMAEIICREPWLYGPDKGMDYNYGFTLWASRDITNNGHTDAPVLHLAMSGDYFEGGVRDICRGSNNAVYFWII